MLLTALKPIEYVQTGASPTDISTVNKRTVSYYNKSKRGENALENE